MPEATDTRNTGCTRTPTSRRRLLTGGAAALAGAGFAGVVLSPDPSWGNPAELHAGVTHPDAALLDLGTALAAARVEEDQAWAAAKGQGREEDDAPEHVWAEEMARRTHVLAEQIHDIPAATLAGLQVKMQALASCLHKPLAYSDVDFWESGVTSKRLMFGVLRDLSTMGGLPV